MVNIDQLCGRESHRSFSGLINHQASRKSSLLPERGSLGLSLSRWQMQKRLQICNASALQNLDRSLFKKCKAEAEASLETFPASPGRRAARAGFRGVGGRRRYCRGGFREHSFGKFCRPSRTLTTSLESLSEKSLNWGTRVHLLTRGTLRVFDSRTVICTQQG